MPKRVSLPVSNREVSVVYATGYSDVVALEASSDLAGAVAVCQSRLDRAGRDGCLAPNELADLPAVDIDHLVARLRIETLGNLFVGEGSCQSCSARVDISFQASSYLEHWRPRRPRSYREAEAGSGWWQGKAPGAAFRVPTVRDILECGWQDDARRRLLDRCLRGERNRSRDAAAERAMAIVAPALRSEVMGTCPECCATVYLEFDARSFCLAELAACASSVLRDVVLLARAFRWTEAEILSLPSSRRRTYVEALRSSPAAATSEEWVA
jgi:hypothetical protein